MVIYEDLEWVMEKIKRENSSDKRSLWAQILFYLVDRNNIDDITRAYLLYEMYPEVTAIFKPVFAPVELESEVANSLRRYGKLSLEAEEKRIRKNDQDIDYQSKLLDYLKQFELGDVNAWWMLNLLFLSSDPNRPGHEFDVDLSSFSLWTQVSDETKQRLIAAAVRYVHEYQSCSIFTEDKHVFRPAVSAFRALYFLALKIPERLDQILSEDWNKWASVILAYPVFDSQPYYDITVHQTLISKLFNASGENFYDLVKDQLKSENATGHLQILKLLENIDSNHLQKLFVSILQEGSLLAYPYEQLLEYLLEQNNAEAKEFALAAIRRGIFSLDESDRQRRLAAAKSLIFNASDAGWPSISIAINKDFEFGKDLFQSLAHARDNLAVVLVSKIAEEEVAALYAWLENNFPAKEDPSVKGFHTVSERESVGQFRDLLIQVLSNKGSEPACKTIAGLIKQYPEKEWLVPYLRKCEGNYRRNTWQPLEPYQILTIIQDAYNRHHRLKRKSSLINIFTAIFAILATVFLAILPSAIDYENNPVLVFFAAHQVQAILVIILSACALVLFNTKDLKQD
jgi:hypothetical protein